MTMIIVYCTLKFESTVSAARVFTQLGVFGLEQAKNGSVGVVLVSMEQPYLPSMIFVDALVPHGAAAKTGKIRVGDQVCLMNCLVSKVVYCTYFFYLSHILLTYQFLIHSLGCYYRWKYARWSIRSGGCCSDES